MSAPAAAGSHAGHNPPEFGAPSTRSPTVSTEPSQPYFYHADIDWFLSPGRAYLYDSAAASVPPTGSHLDALRYQQTGSAMNFSSATYYPGFGTPSTLHPEAGIISPSFPLGYSGHNVGAKLDVDMSKGNFGYEGALPASTGPPGAQLEMLEPVAPVAEQSQSASPNPDAPAAHPHRPSRLRSGSRARRNGPARPSPTAEERKSRSSHNLVEKQYRNRLNAQFDSLLDVLPDAMRSAAVPGPGPGAEESEGVFRADLSTAESCERRVSKGEVLELARRRIQMLERERDDIAYERDRLLVTVDRLRGMLGDDAEDEVDEEEDGIDGDDDHGGDSGEG